MKKKNVGQETSGGALLQANDKKVKHQRMTHLRFPLFYLIQLGKK